MIFQDEIYYQSVYVSVCYIMQYMYLVIVNSVFNGMYFKNATCIDFIIHYTIINTFIEGIDWSICATFLIRGNPLISSATFLKSYSDIIIFQKGRGLKFIQVKISNCPGRGGQTPESYTSNLFLSLIYDSVMKNDLIIILVFLPNII